MIVFLLILMTVLFSWQSSCARLYTENYAGPDSRDASNVYSMFYGAGITIATLAINGFSFHPSLPTFLLGMGNAIVLIVYTTSLTKGSILGPYNFLMLSQLSGGILVPMVYNMLFYGERLTALQLTGIALMMACFVVMNLQGLSFKGQKPSRTYFILCIVLFFVNGFYGQIMNIQQIVCEGAERAEMVICTYAFTAIFVLLYRLIRTPKQLAPAFHMGNKALLFAILACLICTGATNIMVYLISAMDSATILFAIDNGGVLALSGIYAIVLFHEKPTASQIAGILLAVVAIVLLSI